MKKILLSLCLLITCVSATSAATIPSGFSVQLNPTNFAVNEAVDVTIKALDANNAVMTDYDEGIVWMELRSIDGSLVPFDDAVIPSDGLVFFNASDLGQKTLSKSLIIKKEGSYILKVFDIDDERVKGEINIIIGMQQSADYTPISLISPIDGGVETMNMLTVLANVPSLPNSPYQVFLNNIVVGSGTSNAQGDISALVSGMQSGSNAVQVKIVDINSIVLGQSPVTSFVYQPMTDEYFLGIDVVPFSQVKQGDKLVFTVRTRDDISSVELLIGTGTALPMDRISVGNFVKEVVMEHAGSLSTSLRFNIAGNIKLYQDVASLAVTQNISIGPVTFYTESIDKTSLVMQWQLIGQASKFKISYGTNQNNLSQEVEVSARQIQIDNIDPSRVYYFQITPLDQSGNVVGEPSAIKEVDPSALLAQVVCFVDGIDLRTEEIDDKYYFVWDAVENAERYIIYRSDIMTSILSEMRRVGETTDLRFEYPFNKDALQEEFAYYAVIAVCANGKEILLDEIKKVQVGPYDTLFLAIVFSVLFYSFWLLYRRGSLV